MSMIGKRTATNKIESFISRVLFPVGHLQVPEGYFLFSYVSPEVGYRMDFLSGSTGQKKFYGQGAWHTLREVRSAATTYHDSPYFNQEV